MSSCRATNAKGYRDVANALADRIRDVSDNCLGLQVPGTSHVEMLDALERSYKEERRLAENLRARLDRLTFAAREVCRVVPPPTYGNARHTSTVLVVDALRDVLKKGEGLR